MIIYVVVNRWSMDAETRDYFLQRAFYNKKEAEKYRDKISKTEDGNDNFVIEELELQ